MSFATVGHDASLRHGDRGGDAKVRRASADVPGARGSGSPSSHSPKGVFVNNKVSPVPHSAPVTSEPNVIASPLTPRPQEWSEWIEFVRKFHIELRAKHVSVIHGRDARPYLKVGVYNFFFTGLLDSGSEISIISKAALDRLGQEIVLHRALDLDAITTANGSSSPVAGYVLLPVALGGRTSVVKFYVVPGVTTSLLLGINFWQEFDIAPDVLSLLNRGCSFSDTEKTATFDCEIRRIQPLNALSVRQRAEAEDIMLEFESISFDKKGLGRTHLLSHRIDTGGAAPIKQRYYVLSPQKLAELNKQLDEMLQLDVVEPSSSAWNNPITMAPKADGTLRFCLDSRKLNAVSKHDAYPLPYITQILDQLGNAKFLSSIDLKAAFWQIPLDSRDSMEKTAFTVPARGLYHFKVMCFGLTSAPATQQRLMDRLFGPEFGGRIFIYLDDIVIVSATFEEHTRLLRVVLDRLSFAGLTINLQKCQFFRSQLKYLGYVVDEFGLRTDPEKIRAIVDFSVPTTKKEVKRFLGTASYYRRFIKNFSNIAGPLNKLTSTKKGTPPFQWTAEADQAFVELKRALTTAPVLACPDFDKDFVVHCDASDFGVGATLTQRFDGGEHPIAYFSRSLLPAERNYSATEKEAMAVVNAVEHFRPYLEGDRPFTIITDHASLKWFLNLKNPTGRLERWGCRLSPYNFTIQHRRGVDNVVPDALSRSVPVAAVAPTVQTSDDWYLKLFRGCVDRPQSMANYQVESGRLYRFRKGKNNLTDDFQWKEVVPVEYRVDIMVANHSTPTAAHLGVDKTHSRLKLRYFWPGMYQDVVSFVAACEVCKAYKHSNLSKPGLMGDPKVCSRPFQCISVDLVGPLPASRQLNTFLLVVVCCFSKYCLIFPVRRATGKVIAQRLEDHVFLVHGVPQTVLSDNGPQLVGREVQSLFEKYNVPQVHLGPVYCPQVNTVERYNRTIMTAVSSFVGSDHRTWDVNIHKIQFALNTSVNDATSYTPFFLVHGREAVADGNVYSDPVVVDELLFGSRKASADRLGTLKDVYEKVGVELKKAHDRNVKTYNSKRRDLSFNVGDIVWKRTYKLSDASKHFSAKLCPKYEKCIIVKKLSRLVYEVEDENGKPLGKWHIKDIKQKDEGQMSCDPRVNPVSSVVSVGNFRSSAIVGPAASPRRGVLRSNAHVAGERLGINTGASPSHSAAYRSRVFRRRPR